MVYSRTDMRLFGARMPHDRATLARSVPSTGMHRQRARCGAPRFGAAFPVLRQKLER
ncbi:hypothetical protein D9X30_3847 [Cupriavidus sp. U2]|nr:hypothetical protein D9X30_3847 [Cupriavidus sp. U2]